MRRRVSEISDRTWRGTCVVPKCGCESVLLNMNGKDTNTSANRFYTVKRSRKSVSLEIKYKIISLADSGESNTEIARKLELPRTTVVTILKDRARILETIKCQTPMQTRYIPRQGKRECVKGLRMACKRSSQICIAISSFISILISPKSICAVTWNHI